MQNRCPPVNGCCGYDAAAAVAKFVILTRQCAPSEIDPLEARIDLRLLCAVEKLIDVVLGGGPDRLDPSAFHDSASRTTAPATSARRLIKSRLKARPVKPHIP
ncbi:MAG: hypothetical protein AUH79_01290 [Betaproteobacteria bacterium 13_1_40CM_4_64_4]|nr:MAG: hypothetical protein AUH79_01290 [Betaproteobacteria bacterium 13_1_40CM_4_64_4]